MGFLVGFLGPVIAYLSPPWSMAQFACPLCPHITAGFPTRLTWLQIGLTAGLVFGLLYAVTGFGIGYVVSKLRRVNS